MTSAIHDQIGRLSPQIRRYLVGRLPAADVDDAVQEVMVRALQKADTLRDPGRARAWLFQIARNVRVDQLRRGAREVPDDTLEVAVDGPEPGPCACASGLAETLPPAQSEVVRLVDLGSLSLAEAAVRVGRSVNAATVALHRGRRRLRHRLAELCGASDYRSASTCDCDESTCAPHTGPRPPTPQNARQP